MRLDVEQVNDPRGALLIRARHDDAPQPAQDTLRTAKRAQQNVADNAHRWLISPCLLILCEFQCYTILFGFLFDITSNSIEARSLASANLLISHEDRPLQIDRIEREWPCSTSVAMSALSLYRWAPAASGYLRL